MLQRMSVGGDDADGSCPLMVLFVEMLVEAWMMEQPDRSERTIHALNDTPERKKTSAPVV